MKSSKTISSWRRTRPCCLKPFSILKTSVGSQMSIMKHHRSSSPSLSQIIIFCLRLRKNITKLLLCYTHTFSYSFYLSIFLETIFLHPFTLFAITSQKFDLILWNWFCICYDINFSKQTQIIWEKTCTYVKKHIEHLYYINSRIS